MVYGLNLPKPTAHEYYPQRYPIRLRRHTAHRYAVDSGCSLCSRYFATVTVERQLITAQL